MSRSLYQVEDEVNSINVARRESSWATINNQSKKSSVYTGKNKVLIRRGIKFLRNKDFAEDTEKFFKSLVYVVTRNKFLWIFIRFNQH